MTIEQTIQAFESRQADPVELIDSLITAEPDGATALINRLEASQLNKKELNQFERFFHGFSSKLRTERLAVQRVVIALGAIRAQTAIPSLLGWLANTSIDRKISLAAGWSLANIGEEAIMPIYLFARCRDILESARSLAITSLGYIVDPRIPSLLRQLWREYRLEVPSLVIAALTGLSMREGVEASQKLARETEQLWRHQRIVDEDWGDYWTKLKLEASIDRLKASLDQVQPGDHLPPWPNVLRVLESS